MIEMIMMMEMMEMMEMMVMMVMTICIYLVPVRVYVLRVDSFITN
jgi:hypothetical protein